MTRSVPPQLATRGHIHDRPFRFRTGKSRCPRSCGHISPGHARKVPLRAQAWRCLLIPDLDEGDALQPARSKVPAVGLQLEVILSDADDPPGPLLARRRDELH